MSSVALYVLWHTHRVRHVSTCGALPLGVGPVMAVPSDVVHRMEGHASGLDGHIRGAHNVPGEIKKVSLETLFPPWTVTRQVYTESLASRHSGISNDVLLFSDIGLSLVHHYRVHMRGVPHVTFRRNYLKQLHALLPLPTVLPIACSTLPCAAEYPDVVCASTVQTRDQAPAARPGHGFTCPHRAGPTGCSGGAGVRLSSPVVADR